MAPTTRLRPLPRRIVAIITLFVTPGIAAPVGQAPPAPAAPRAPAASAPASSDLAEVAAAMPAGTLALMTIPNRSAFGTQIRSSALHKIWSDSQVQKFLEKPLALLKPHVQLDLSAGIDARALDELFDGPLAIALTHLRLPAPGTQTLPDIGLVVYGKASSTEKAKEVRTLAGRLLESRLQGKAEQRKVGDAEVDSWTFPAIPIGVETAQRGQRWYASLSRTAIETVLSLPKDGKGSLAADPHFQKVAGKLSAREIPILLAYANVEGLLATFVSRLPEPVRIAIDKSGITGLKAFGFGTAVKDGAFIDSTYTVAPAPRTGLLRLWQTEPVNVASLSLVPKDAISAGVHRLNLAALWDTGWDMMTVFDPTVAERARKELTALEKELGFALKADLIDSLGTELISYSKPSLTGVPDFIIYAELRDRAKFGECLRKVASKIEGVSIKEIAAGDVIIHHVSSSQLAPLAMFFQPAYAFSGKYLVLSFNVQSIRTALTTSGAVAKDRASIRDNEQFKPLLVDLPPSLVSLSLEDTRRSFESAYNAMRGVLPFVVAAAGQELPVDFALLPTADVFTRHLVPGISYGVADDEGFTQRSRTAVSATIVVPFALAVGLSVVLLPRIGKVAQANR